MTKKILFIEDEREFAEVVTPYLEKNNFVVTGVSLGQSGLQKLEENSYDLVILDLGLPDMDGLKLCQKIREKKKIPILILTARDKIEDKVIGLNAGADDYLVKPVALRELVIRTKRLMKRDLKGTFRSSMFEFEGISFNTVTGKLTSERKSIQLTKKERLVLEYLLLRKGRVLTRLEIMDHGWGQEIDPFSNTVNMMISSLRKKLRQLTSHQFIHSVHGLGYKLEVNDE